MGKLVVYVCAIFCIGLLLLKCVLTTRIQSSPSLGGQDGASIQYGRNELLSLRTCTDISALQLDIPLDCDSNNSWKTRKTHKRGKRGGVRRRVRSRPTRPPLPTILLSNVRSLRNKLIELSACVKYMFEYRDSCILCFTETWLNDTVPNNSLELPGFGSPVRLDRDSNLTGKSIGGGVCLYVNSKWCKNIVQRETYCSTDIELLCVSLRPFYLPREFGQIFVTVVYVPPSANNKTAADHIQNHVQRLENISPDAPKLILGDFNSCTLKDSLPHYHQYVQCATRRSKTLDLCYGNIKQAYTAVSKAPLGASDHNSVHLIPRYRQKLKTGTIVKKSVKVWNAESINSLKGCFECTDWDVLFGECDDPCELNDIITAYITFCVDSVIPTRDIKIYPNNKPWVSKELKSLLNEKKRAFCANDRECVNAVQKSINAKIKQCKEDFKNKVEEQFRQNNSRQAWEGIKTMIGTESRKQISVIGEESDFAQQLNMFYSRFDIHDFSLETNELLCNMSVSDNDLCLTEEEVRLRFGQLNIRKSSGPDDLSGMLLKECKDQLSSVFCKLFQLSLDKQIIPKRWKLSEIIPVQKKPKPTVNNDFRPVALTSVVMKCFERIVLRMLSNQVSEKLDPLQFAYRARRGVEDATITLLHNIYQHLENTGAYARILFVDFSSAFNTIQPHILIKKLIDLEIRPQLIRWISSFLLHREQYVKVNNVRSSSTITNTGAPQGCVLSPMLFTLYTNDCVSSTHNCDRVKFADDTAIGSLLYDNEDSYKDEVSAFTEWCKVNFLELNVKKTKELIIDFRRKKSTITPVLIDNQAVDVVEEYKYLGTIIDNKLTFTQNTNAVYNKCQSRLHFLRKLRSFHVDSTLMSLFYKSCIQSVLTFCIQCWYGPLSLQNKNKLKRVVKVAEKIVGLNFDSLDTLYMSSVLNLSVRILQDQSHVLHSCYQLLPSGRRYLLPSVKSNRNRHSFIPVSISHLNKS